MPTTRWRSKWKLELPGKCVPKPACALHADRLELGNKKEKDKKLELLDKRVPKPELGNKEKIGREACGQRGNPPALPRMGLRPKTQKVYPVKFCFADILLMQDDFIG